VAGILDRFPGCTTVKIKVAESGQQLVDDVARVAAVLQARPDARIRVDANGAWTVAEAAHAVRVLDQAVRAVDATRAPGTGPVSLDGQGLEYVEQPCATVEELVRLRARLAADGVHVDVAADESIRRAEDPLAVVRAEAADVVVLKVQPLGGVRACLSLAEAVGLPVVVSSALESSVGLAAGVALAAALPELPYACGLATAQLLTDDVVAEPLLPVAGALPVRRPEPDAQHLAAAAADDDLARRWRERVTAVTSVLTEGA
jgi:O-succinylbenzoate synthase